MLLPQRRGSSIVQSGLAKGLTLVRRDSVHRGGCRACTGWSLGSFLNVVIWRVPRRESIVKPRSHCPACDTQIATRDNIPLVSWLVLRGRCRHCGNPISIRYPLVELFTGVLFAAVGARFAHSLGAAGVPRAHRCADRDLGDRSRALHHPEPHRVPGRFRECVPARRWRRSSRITGGAFGRSLLGALRRSRSSSCCTSSRPGGWASATYGCRSCSACSSGGWAGRELLGGLFAGLLLRRGHRRSC